MRPASFVVQIAFFSAILASCGGGGSGKNTPEVPDVPDEPMPSDADATVDDIPVDVPDEIPNDVPVAEDLQSNPDPTLPDTAIDLGPDDAPQPADDGLQADDCSADEAEPDTDATETFELPADAADTYQPSDITDEFGDAADLSEDTSEVPDAVDVKSASMAPVIGGYNSYTFDTKGASKEVADLVQMYLDGGTDLVAVYLGMFDGPPPGGIIDLILKIGRDKGGKAVSVEDLVNAGGVVFASYGEKHWMKVPLPGLVSLVLGAENIDLSGLSLPKNTVIKPVAPGTGVLAGAELSAIGVHKCHQKGQKGKGVKVAVFDHGFMEWDKSQKAGALPADTTLVVKDVPLDNMTNETIWHGTAVAEAVARVAPEAELYLVQTLDWEVQLPIAVNWAIDNGIQVVNASWMVFNASFYDGEGPVSAMAKMAWDNGVTWVSASGNYASGEHWYGSWKDDDGSGWMEFSGGEEINHVTLSDPQSMSVLLTWDGPDADQIDLDLCVRSVTWEKDTPLVKQEVTDCFDGWDGTSTAAVKIVQANAKLCEKKPDEYLCTDPTFGIIVRQSPASPKPANAQLMLSMFVSQLYSDQSLEFWMPENSVADPAVHPDLITVGAIHMDQWLDGTRAVYSSFGPTNAGVGKPEIMGPSDVDVHTKKGFSGTSAASPFVAGVSALIRAEKPAWLPADVKAELIARASHVTEVVPDQETGFGRLSFDCDWCKADCKEKECGPDPVCGKSCGECTGCGKVCIAGACMFTACLGKQCGGDGCGGLCGLCAPGVICLDGACCKPSCGGKECGDDGCGGGPCGECGTGAACLGGMCFCGVAGEKCGVECCKEGQVCIDGACCTPLCIMAECGGDGCGGSCGSCGDGFVCQEGNCVCDEGLIACGSACCGGDQVCVEDQCCTPDCAGAVCGDDGCGGSCGECVAGFACLMGGCVCDEGFTKCGASCCKAGQVCVDDACCTPSCMLMVCGDDGCGGSCGECGPQGVCYFGLCACGLGTTQCGTNSCCLPSEKCEAGVCVSDCPAAKDCTGRECGPDPVCTESCGTCPVGLACGDQGKCGCPLWEKHYAAGAGQHRSATDAVALPDGGFVFVSRVAVPTPQSDTLRITRLDANGVVVWEKQFDGGAAVDGTGDLIPTKDGGYVTCGNTTSKGAGDFDLWVVKFDAAGTVLWDKTFGGKGSDACRDLVENADGTLTVAGYTYSKGSGASDGWLLKLDTVRTLIWDKVRGNASWDNFYAVRPKAGGGYLVAGYTTPTGASKEDGWLLSYDAAGNFQWEKKYGETTRAERFHAMVLPSSGGILLVGNREQGVSYYDDGWIVRTDSTGVMTWQQFYTGSYFETPYSAVEAADGSFVVAGMRAYTNPGDWQGWAFRIDATGKLIWSNLFGGAGGDEFSTIKAAGSRFVATGYYKNQATGWLNEAMLVVMDVDGNVSCE